MQFAGCWPRRPQRHWWHAFVSSRLDLLQTRCCMGCQLPLSTKLQLIQNHAARVVDWGPENMTESHLCSVSCIGLPMSPAHHFSNCSRSPTRPCTGRPPVYLCELAVRLYTWDAHSALQTTPTRLAETTKLAAKYPWGSQFFARRRSPPYRMIYLAVWERRSQCTLSRGSLKTLLFWAHIWDSDNETFFLSRLDTWNLYLKHEQTLYTGF